MVKATTHEAKTNLSRLLKLVINSKELNITLLPTDTAFDAVAQERHW